MKTARWVDRAQLAWYYRRFPRLLLPQELTQGEDNMNKDKGNAFPCFHLQDAEMNDSPHTQQNLLVHPQLQGTCSTALLQLHAATSACSRANTSPWKPFT